MAVRIRMLGGFGVTVDDVPVPSEAWSRRQAAALVKVLALTAGRRLHGWSGVPGLVRRPWGPGWALVGDAGYFKDPITAHGITDALRDAELLADATLDTFAGRPQAVAMSCYQAIRTALSRQLLAVTEHVAGYAWDSEEVRGLLRQVSASMSDELEHLEARGSTLPAPRHLTDPWVA